MEAFVMQAQRQLQMRLEMHQKHITAMLKGGAVHGMKLEASLAAATPHHGELNPPGASNQLLTQAHATNQAGRSGLPDASLAVNPALHMQSGSEHFTHVDAADFDGTPEFLWPELLQSDHGADLEDMAAPQIKTEWAQLHPH